MASVSIPAERPGGLLRRPHATTGFWSWFTTVDHKKIGILYGITAFAFFLIGGTEALLIRLQLARPDQTVEIQHWAIMRHELRGVGCEKYDGETAEQNRHQ